MDVFEIFLSASGALIVAFISILVDRWLAARKEFNTGITGLEYEIIKNHQVLLDLENIVKHHIEQTESQQDRTFIFAIPPYQLLEYSYIHCRTQGFLLKMPTEEQTAINELYTISDFINEFIRRDFELSIISSGKVDAIIMNKIRSWKQILNLIEEFKKRVINIDLKPYLKGVKLIKHKL